MRSGDSFRNFPYCYWNHKMSKEEEIEAYQYTKRCEEQERLAKAYAETWTVEEMRRYIFEEVFDADDDVEEIEVWIQKYGLKKCFEITYRLFGED